MRSLRKLHDGTGNAWVQMLAVLLSIGSILLSMYAGRRGWLVYWNFAVPLLLLTMGYSAGRHHGSILPEVKIVLAYLAWFTVSRILNGDHYLDAAIGDVYALGIAFWIVLPMDGFVSVKNRKRVETVVLTAVILAVTVISVVSIAVAVRGESITLPFAALPIEMGEYDQRLYVWGNHPNIVAAIMAPPLLMAIYMAVRYPRWWSIVLYTAMALVIYFAISLTVSRTAMMMLAACIGLFAACVAVHNITKPSVWMSRIIAVGLACVVMLGVYKGFDGAVQLVTWASGRQSTAQVVQQQGTEASAGQGVVAQRDLSMAMPSIGGRMPVYLAMMQYLPEHPKTLLIGNLDTDIMPGINKIVGTFQFSHMHNSALQVLMLTGIPGLILMLWFILRLLLRCLHLFFGKGHLLEERMLALIPIITLGHSLLEPFIFGQYGLINLLFFLSSGLAIYHSESLKAPKDKAATGIAE